MTWIVYNRITRAVDPHSFFVDPDPVLQNFGVEKLPYDEFSVIDSTTGLLLPF